MRKYCLGTKIRNNYTFVTLFVFSLHSTTIKKDLSEKKKIETNQNLTEKV